MLSQLVVNGLAAGSVYALVALALVIVYKASHVANFAQGEMGMISTFVGFVLLSSYGLPLALALTGTLLWAAALGAFLEFALIRRAKRPSPLNLIILTLGFQLVLFGLAGWRWGAEGRAFPAAIGHGEVVALGSVVLSRLDLLSIGVALALMATMAAAFRLTRLGLAIRATQQNELAARINGVRTHRVRGVSFALASVVGTVAALLIVPVVTLDPTLMWDPLLKGFAAAVLGGLTTPVGAVLGGYLLGLIESLFGGYVSLEFRAVVPFAVMVLVLWFRPSGLFGRHYVRKV